METKEESRQRYAARKSAGICVRCNNPVEEGYSHCKQCLEKKRIDGKESRKFYLKIGVCPRCRKETLFGDEKMCPECKAYFYTHNEEYRNRPNSNGETYYQQRKRRLEEAGLCQRCAREKRSEGHIYCPECLIKTNAYARHKKRLRKNIGVFIYE